MNKFLYSILWVFFVCSCSHDEDFNPLENTDWVHEFQEYEHISDYKAVLYHFGAENAEYYAIGEDNKIVRRLRIYPYSVSKNEVTIGARSFTLTDYTLEIDNMLFIKQQK